MNSEDFIRLAASQDKLPKPFMGFTDLKQRNADGKLQVDLVFSKPGTGMPYFEEPPFNTPEDLRNDFDRPEELVFVSAGGMLTLVRKSHMEYIKRREAIAHEVLEKYGVISFEQMGGISLEKVLEIRKEIEERMKNVN